MSLAPRSSPAPTSLPSPALIHAVRRLNVRLGWIFGLSLLTLIFSLGVFDHWQRARASATFLRAARPALAAGHPRHAAQILRPALLEGFSTVEIRDARGAAVVTLSRRARPSWRFVTITRPIEVGDHGPRAGRFKTMAFTYPLDPPFVVLLVASLGLLVVFELVRRSARRGLALADQVVRARHREKSERRLAEQLAHDIRSPLSAMSLTLGRRGDISAAERSLLLTAARRITEITDDLLSSARAPLDYDGLMDASRVVADVFDEIRAAHADRTDLQLRFNLERTPLLCRGPAPEVARIVSNLLTNAIEAVEGRGTVTLSARRGKDGIEVDVRDDGRGIAAEVLEKLGRGRVSVGKERPRAGGLGLSHAFDVARTCGGRLRLTSAPGEGTSATLTLRNL